MARELTADDALNAVWGGSLLACGGGGNSSGTNPVAYTIQIQGKANAQVVKITTAGLIVQ